MMSRDELPKFFLLQLKYIYQDHGAKKEGDR